MYAFGKTRNLPLGIYQMVKKYLTHVSTKALLSDTRCNCTVVHV